MSKKNTVMVTGFVLWVLGILVGASAGEIWPGQMSISAKLVLGLGLLASLGNFAALYKKAQ